MHDYFYVYYSLHGYQIFDTWLTIYLNQVRYVQIQNVPIYCKRISTGYKMLSNLFLSRQKNRCTRNNTLYSYTFTYRTTALKSRMSLCHCVTISAQCGSFLVRWLIFEVTLSRSWRENEKEKRWVQQNRSRA